MRNLITQLVAVTLIGTALSACYAQGSRQTPKVNLTNTPTLVSEQKTHVGLIEIFESAPTNSINQDDWDQWGNNYEGIRVNTKGRFTTMSAHPHEGKLFMIMTLYDEDANGENNTPQVAYLVENAHSIFLGEEEGSFLIDDEVWIYLGHVYNFEGTISKFSRFDSELANSGYENLIIVRGKSQDLSEEIADGNTFGTSNGLGDVEIVTLTPDISEDGNQPSTLTAIYSTQETDTSVSPLWDISEVSCEEKPIYMWVPPGVYLYEKTRQDGGIIYATVERNSIQEPDEDQCRMPWPNFGIRLLEPPEYGFQMSDNYDVCDYERSRPPGQISISVEGTADKSVGFGTFQAVKVTTLQTYNIPRPPNYPQGNFITNEWYACGLGLISSSTSHVGRYQHRDLELAYGLELISFTPISTNESYVRFMLADVQLGDLVEHYRANINNEETAEALRRWNAGIRVNNIEMFERKIVDGQWLIVYTGTDDPISGTDVILNSD